MLSAAFLVPFACALIVDLCVFACAVAVDVCVLGTANRKSDMVFEAPPSVAKTTRDQKRLRNKPEFSSNQLLNQIRNREVPVTRTETKRPPWPSVSVTPK